jgi:hypothetical protein
MKAIVEFEIVDHGIENEQYFQGCGIAFTEYDDVATGIGDTLEEAIDDALESLAQNDWDTEGMEARIKADNPRFGTPCTETEMYEECHYYASIRVK